ncbi:MAG TPA: nuclear transport factor 2 family protein [Planctomycetota bacterium]|nr:nuclear transport factor 2 family protein [Planctomycetota bacterium]
MKAPRLFLSCAVSLGLCSGLLLTIERASPQEPQSTGASVRRQEEAALLRPEDTRTLDGLIAALYDVISGPKGQDRDWNRFRNLFHPEGRLVPISPRNSGAAAALVLSPDGYIQRFGSALKSQGFFEKEVDRRTEIFHRLANVWSTYEGRSDPADATPIVKGINSIQACFDGHRWWLLHVIWCPEDAAHPLPEAYDRHR